MSKPHKKKKSIFNVFKHTNIPLSIYIVLLTSMAFFWWAQKYIPDLSLNIFSELFGTAFTVFIIDIISNQNKEKKFINVKENINDLITRELYIILDGVSFKVLNIKFEIPENDNILNQIVETRAKKHQALFSLTENDFMKLQPYINEEIVNHKDIINYLKNRSDSIWKLINFQYSEFYPPEIVEGLTNVYSSLINLRQAIRQFQKESSIDQRNNYYNESGKYMISKQTYLLIENIKLLLLIEQLKLK